MNLSYYITSTMHKEEAIAQENTGGVSLWLVLVYVRVETDCKLNPLREVLYRFGDLGVKAVNHR